MKINFENKRNIIRTSKIKSGDKTLKNLLVVDIFVILDQGSSSGVYLGVFHTVYLEILGV